ncbi:MAG: dephospho-CoA kinase [Lachnospiraceae bacterium]|nr:dephospho-CoA kinase [Lachnospiraceae bacterium]
MKVIGITGGVGSGKTQILTYLQERTNCRIIVADRVAHELEEPGGACYEQIVTLLGEEILGKDGSIIKTEMASRIFSDSNLLIKINEIIHPAVKEYVRKAIAEECEKGQIDYLFIEAALLIEDGYDEIVDEMWYIHTDEPVRRERLKLSRGYSDKKIDAIIKEQLAEEEFYRHCCVVIDNSKALQNAFRQIDEKLGEDLCQKQ